MVAGFASCKKVTHLFDLLVIQFAHIQRGFWIEVLEQGPDHLETPDMLIDIGLVMPAFIQNNRDHGPVKHGISSGTDRQVDIGNFCGFRNARIHDHQDLVRVFTELVQHPAGLGQVVTHHGVPAHRQKHVGFIEIRSRMKMLVAKGFTVRPEAAGQFLAQGIVEIL